MLKHLSIALLVFISLQAICIASKYDGGFGDFQSDDEDKVSSDKREDAMMDQQEATQFLKRLFHPFSTKNEEIKRETIEVYEEKCESIIPGQRFCPELKTWKLFKDYENGKK